MEKTFDSLICANLEKPVDAVLFSISRDLSALRPELAVAETTDYYFNLGEFENLGGCSVARRDGVHSQMLVDYFHAEDRLTKVAENAWQIVEWETHPLEVLTVGLRGKYGVEHHHFVIGKSGEIAEEFILACCRSNAKIRGEVLVFNGCWQKDKQLFENIKHSTLENLILEPGLKEQIAGDFDTFFKSREVYAKYRIPWKRGVLLLGPPGNGKTHLIKALVNRLGVPCLYVRSMKDMHQTDEAEMAQVFRMARDTAPCMLIFEDLDSQITNENRSFFLNELDGFAANEGIMTVASTNHPERLDPAILERPSRFDRKYTFNLPGLNERRRYLAMQIGGLETELQLPTAQIDALAEATGGFSFAYLKELVLSSLMSWMSLGGSRGMSELMMEQVGTMRAQMKTPEPLVAATDDD
jgi:hypothetical protein